MIHRFRQFPPACLLVAALCLSGFAAPAAAAEDGAGSRRAPASEPQGVRAPPVHKSALSPIRPVAVDGMRGVETYCGAVAASAASARLAWQEQRIKTLQAELVVKIAELDAKSAEIRQWVQKREQFLARANDDLTAIFAKMKPEAASAQLQAMDEEAAAALLARLKPAAASAVMSEMDPARAARLSDLLAAKSDGKKS